MIKRPQIWIKNPHAVLILLLLASTMALELGLTLGAEVLASSPLPTPQAPCTASSTSNSYNCTRDEGLEKEWAKWEEANKPIKVQVIVTGYSSRVQETDDTPEIAANGKNIWNLYQKGEKTCATNDYPFGTILKIENLGTCIVRDRMNKRFTGKSRVDWYYGYDTITAINHGKKVLYAEVTHTK